MATWYCKPAGATGTEAGTSWANAKQYPWDLTSGELAAGDTIKVAKSTSPVQLAASGCTWTKGAGLTLGSAKTMEVQKCNTPTGWTASTNVSLSANASYTVFSTGSLNISFTADFTTGKLCYHTYSSTQDFSAYQQISFLFRYVLNRTYSSGDFKIKLCSDSTGDTPVATFSLPALDYGGFTMYRCLLDNGGALPSGVNSVAIYLDVDYGGSSFIITNIIACKESSSSDCLHHGLLLSPYSGERDIFFPIRYIDGTDIKFSLNNGADNDDTYGVFPFDTISNTTVYTRIPYMISMTNQSTVPWNSQKSGTSGNIVTYTGGWDADTDTQTGETIFFQYLKDATSIFSANSGSYFKLTRLSFASGGIRLYGDNFEYSDVVCCLGMNQGIEGSAYNYTIDNIKLCGFNISYNGLSAGAGIISNSVFVCYRQGNQGMFRPSAPSLERFTTKMSNCVFRYHTAAFGTGANTVYENCEIYNSQTSDIYNAVPTNSVARNCLFGSTTEVSGFGSQYPSNHNLLTFKSINHDQVQGAMLISGLGSYCVWNATNSEWQLYIPNNDKYDSTHRYTIEVAQVKVNADLQVTCNLYVKKSHATNIGAALIVFEDDYVLNIASDVEDVKANDTDYEQLTIQFTPGEAGVARIYVEGWYVAAAGTVYFKDFTWSQALS